MHACRRALCVIVLTTHSMAEAEALADDIHVLHEGHLIASGSSTSLTAQYGWGYTLRILLERHPCSQFVDSDGAATTGSRQPPALLQEQQRTKAAAAERDMAAAAAGLVDLVQRRIPEAELLSAAGAELSFRMPGDASEAAAGLLDALAAAQAELGVASYTFSTTTLQEVRWACYYVIHVSEVYLWSNACGRVTGTLCHNVLLQGMLSSAVQAV